MPDRKGRLRNIFLIHFSNEKNPKKFIPNNLLLDKYFLYFPYHTINSWILQLIRVVLINFLIYFSSGLSIDLINELTYILGVSTENRLIKAHRFF